MHFVFRTFGSKKSNYSCSDNSESCTKEQLVASQFPNEGLQVISVLGGSPALDAGLIPFFDIIISVDTQSFVSSDSAKDYTDFLRDFSESHVDTPISLRVWNTKILATREVLLTPNRRWGGPGTLGLSVRWSSKLEAISKCVHVIDVAEGGAASGFVKAGRDYIVGFRHLWDQYATLVENECALQVASREALQRKQGEVALLSFFIYDNEANNIREVQISIPPSGKVGLAVAHGVAHWIPTRKCPEITDEENVSSAFRSSLSSVCNTYNFENDGTIGLPVFLVSQLFSSVSSKNVSLSCDDEKRSEVKAPTDLKSVAPVSELHTYSDGNGASEPIVEAIVPSQSDFTRIRSSSSLTPLGEKKSIFEESDGEKNSPLIPKTEDYPIHDNNDTSEMEDKKNVTFIPPESVSVPDKSSNSEQDTPLGNSPFPLLPLSGANSLFSSPSSEAGFRCRAKGIPDVLPPFPSSSNVDVFASPFSSRATKSISKKERELSTSIENVSLMDPVQFYLMEPGFVPVTSPPPILFPSCYDGSEKIPFPSPFLLAPGGVASTTFFTGVPFSDETHLPFVRSAESSLPKDGSAKLTLTSSREDLEKNEKVNTLIENKVTGTVTVELLPSSVLPESDLSKRQTRSVSGARQDTREKEDISIERNCSEEKQLQTTIPSPLHFPLYEEICTYFSDSTQLFLNKQ